MIEIASATRLSKNAFWEKTALGISLRRLAHDKRISSFIAFENRRGLPEVYNARINNAKSADILVFVHDDVWIDDFFIADRLLEGVNQFDVLGIAGNRQRVANQAGWLFLDDAFKRDENDNLSGSIAHGNTPFGTVSYFGPAPAECELMDGVFLAASKKVLLERQVAFDPQFEFHFYDMDFCRSARAKGLRLGTWPISLTHQSSGMFDSPAWREKYAAYLRKWST
jgi:GT2 family glycosyltransferase